VVSSQLKNISQLGIFPNFRGENSCHHPANYISPFKPLSNRNDLQDIDEACNAIGLRHVQDQFLEDFFADGGVDKAGQKIDLSKKIATHP